METISSKIRHIKQIIEPRLVVEGAGVLLRRSFGPHQTNLFDPFLLFDHFAFNDPNEGPILGFPTHPHRGIETVTYMLAGDIRHRDSLGNLGVIGPGDMQWMTSGSGILHEEMPSRNPEGKVVGFQLWVNLPAANKMDVPRYQEIKANDVESVTKEGAVIRVVAGQFENVLGPVRAITIQPVYMEVSLQPSATFELAIPREHFALAYLFDGEAVFGADGNQEAVTGMRMIVFDEGERILFRSTGDVPARLMIMSGLPIREPIFPYGPFVMNTQAEIQQALNELCNGTFIKA